MKKEKKKQLRVFFQLFTLIAVVIMLAIFTGCPASGSPDLPATEDLVDSIPELDFSMVSQLDRSISRTLTLPTSDDRKGFINAVMGEKMYADVLNGVIQWVKQNAHKYSEGTPYIVGEDITVTTTTSSEDVTLRVETLTYSKSANEVKIYIFFPEPPETDSSQTNPFRLYIWNRENPEGGFICDYAWASYADETDYPYAPDPFVNGDSRNDYMSTYFFRINTKDNKAYYYTGGSDDTYSGYGELQLNNATNRYGYLAETVDYDGTTMTKNLIYSDSNGFYIYLDEELGDYEDVSDPNTGDFFIDRSYVYNDAFSAWPGEFDTLKADWIITSDVAAKVTTFNAANYIPRSMILCLSQYGLLYGLIFLQHPEKCILFVLCPIWV